MKVRDIVVGFFIVLVIVFGGKYLLQKKGETPKITNEPNINVEDKLEDSLGINIPDDVLKVELKGASGEGIFYPGNVVADLPDVEVGSFYEVWLVGNENYVPLGRLTDKKGGWILDFSSKVNIEGFEKVIVSRETKMGKTPSQVVLEGKF